MTSHDVVLKVRRALGIKAVGHTGTLDPFASGVMVLVLGSATRLARFIEQDTKEYTATARLGSETSTDDLTGVVTSESEVVVADLQEEQIDRELQGLTGAIEQLPPAYSAKWVGGTRSYTLARRGEVVPLQPVTVQVASLKIVSWRPPDLEFKAVVGAGTYLRALARDLGRRLGTGAHLRALRRDAVGFWRSKDAVALTELSAKVNLINPSSLLESLPLVELSEVELRQVSHGVLVPRPDTFGRARLEYEGRLVAVGEARAVGWHPIVVLNS